MKTVKILLVEDDEAAQFGYSSYLSTIGYAVQPATTLAAARDAVASQVFDAVLLDLHLPDGNALDWIPDLRRDLPAIAVIVITGSGGVATAVQAMKSGADNFLTKPVNMDELVVSLDKCLATSALRKRDSAFQLLKLRDDAFFGASALTRTMLEHAEVAASNDTTVMLQGETGTGKGVLARWIHEHSARRGAAMVELNCSALRGDLLRSELFGHSKGAFTSAVRDREGLIEAADGGTLFLDEIGDMDMEVQAQLLKTIEEKTFRRVGENRLRTSDFRLVCATNRNLQEASEKGTFRKDLYYRITVFPIALPLLRSVAEDIPGLAEHLLSRLGYTSATLGPEATQVLTSYAWPGNVRELRNMLERACLLSRGAPLTSAHFPGLQSTVAPAATANGIQTWNLDEAEVSHIQRAIAHFQGDKNKAAKALGVSLSALYRRLSKPSGSTLPSKP